MLKMFSMVTLALVVMVGVAAGAVIPVPSASFEDPDISPETETNDYPSGWWFAGTYSGGGFMHSDPSEATDGDQFVEIRNNADWDGSYKYGVFFDDNIGTDFEEGMLYNLTLDVKLADQAPTDGNIDVRLQTTLGSGRKIAGQVKLAIGDDITAEDGWMTVSTGWVEATDVHDGNGIRLQLEANRMPLAGDGVYFDNVRLEAIPEPATMLMMTTGLVGAWGLRRRRKV